MSINKLGTELCSKISKKGLCIAEGGTDVHVLADTHLIRDAGHSGLLCWSPSDAQSSLSGSMYSTYTHIHMYTCIYRRNVQILSMFVFVNRGRSDRQWHFEVYLMYLIL